MKTRVIQKVMLLISYIAFPYLMSFQPLTQQGNYIITTQANWSMGILLKVIEGCLIALFLLIIIYYKDIVSKLFSIIMIICGGFIIVGSWVVFPTSIEYSSRTWVLLLYCWFGIMALKKRNSPIQ